MALGLRRLLGRAATKTLDPGAAPSPPVPVEMPEGKEARVDTAQTETRYADLLRRLDGAILWEADPLVLQFSFVSASAGSLLGYPIEQWTSERRFFEKHVHPDDWIRLLETLYRATAEGGLRTCEHRMIRADGAVLWAHTAVRPGTLESGAPALFGTTLSITDAKQKAEDSADDAADYRRLLESVQDYALFMLSPDGRVEDWNPGAQRLKGYRAHEIIGASVDRFFPPEEVEKGTLKQLLSKAEREGTATYEGWLVRKGGEQFWGLVTMGAVDDEDGRLRGFSNIARDLSERKRTEEALSRSEEHFRLLVGSIQDYGMFMLSTRGLVESWNPGAQRLKGYRAHEVIGVSIERFFPPEVVDEGVVQRLLKQAELEGTATYEGWLIRKNGARFWGLVTLSAVEDEEGRLRGLSNVARDLSERKHIERTQAFLSEVGEVLAGSLEYQTTLDKIARLATRELADWCVIHKVDGDMIRPVIVVHADERMAQRAHQVLGAISLDARLPHGVAHVVRTGQPELQANVTDTAWIVEALEVKAPEVLRELGVRSCMCVPLTARGRTFGAMSFISTSPDRRYGAADLRVAEDLARRAALAVDNALLYHEAQDAAQARDELISMASHDLRTPLSTVRLQVQRLLREGRKEQGRELPSDVAASLASVGTQVERLVHLMDTLLDVSRITAGQLELHRESVDLAAIVRECAGRLGEDVAQAGSELCVHADAPVLGRWDRTRLEQVVTNLVSNAVKYGEGRPIEVAVTQARTRATLRVRDQGVGIAPEHHAGLFDRFARAGADRRIGGFGVGLWIVRRIVEAHGGEIRVESAPGAGSTFTVELPLGG